MYFYLLLIFSFYFISGKELYHGCTDTKPLLLLLLLLLLLSIIHDYTNVTNFFLIRSRL